ncbi:hypothetical protein [Neolewinella antarctica]|uniref:Type II toxin-antitoxin system RelE/ParE family toxin n=1 Tax=Neolewinella antarctica TaxID=442734 RepID=A0ABX0XG24_9BACT|nr:hypothetical protein [Neolewinella antarctica]NJC27859.1 hypothetical protein [Neolewinella antarctica]
MPTFALCKVELPIHAPVSVYWLEVDGRAPYLTFEKKMLKAGNKKELSRLAVYLEELAYGRSLPNNAIKELRGVPAEDTWREFELRVKQLRLYYFLLPPDGRVIVLGQIKKGDKEQAKAIAELRQLKAGFKAAYGAGQTTNEEE